jgi:hypothetical protein
MDTQAWYAGGNGMAVAAIRPQAPHMVIDAMAGAEGSASRDMARIASQDMAGREWTLDAYGDCLSVARHMSLDYRGATIRVHLCDGTHRAATGAYRNTIAFYYAGERIR